MNKRWFPLPDQAKNHPVQLALRDDFLGYDYRGGESRYHVVAAGRRSYKTERMKRWFVLMATMLEGERYFLGAPTRSQAKLIFWNDLLELTDPRLLDGAPNRSELVLRYVTGSEIHVVGLEAYKRVEGVRWNACGISEYQEVAGDFLSRTLEPILNDTHGRAIVEGRPVGRNHFYDDFKRVESGDPLWRSYTWKSSDILSTQQIDAARRTLSEDDYRREYEADFEAGSSRTYHSFDLQNLYAYTLDLNAPVILACDFNATEKPMSWNIGQERDGKVYWAKTLSYRHTNTQAMCLKLDEYFPVYPHTIILYGDFAGSKNTSNSSYSDWQIIETHLRNKCRIEKRVKPCKSVRDRVAATNALLCNGLGERRMFAHPEHCKPLIDDWDRVQWKDNGVELDGSDPLRTHASDAVDYYSDKEHPVRGKPTYGHTR